MDNNSAVKRKNKFFTRQLYGGITASIPLIGFALFTLVPLIVTISTMFVSMDGYDFATMKWNNFENFKEVFTDERFWHSVGISFIFVIPHMLGLLISLLLSAFLAQKMCGSNFFKAFFFVPYICSTVTISVMWRWIFDQNIGVLNDIIMRITGNEEGVKWFTDPGNFTAMLITVMVWQAPGYGIVMFAAAFTNVNPALYEAAKIDGAGAVKRFFSVTLPSISPTIFYLLIAGIIAGLQTFDIPQIFAGDSWTGEAGPNDAALTTSLYIYHKGIMFSNMPVGSVMSMMLFIIVFTLVVINFKLSKKWVNYDV